MEEGTVSNLLAASRLILFGGALLCYRARARWGYTPLTVMSLFRLQRQRPGPIRYGMFP
jgi:hypothetical protein